MAKIEFIQLIKATILFVFSLFSLRINEQTKLAISGNKIIIDKIGIGNTQPSAEIHIGNPLVDDVRDTIIITRGGIGIGTADLSNVDANLYNLDGGCLFGSVGIGTTTIVNDTTDLYVVGNSEFYGNVGIGTTNPTDKLTVRGGDISVGINTSNGLVLTSANGTKYKLFVSNAGVLSTVLVT